MGVASAFGALEDGDASSVSLSELPLSVYPGSFASSVGSEGAVTQVLGLVSLLAVSGVEVVSTVGVSEGDEASSVSLSSYHRRCGRIPLCLRLVLWGRCHRCWGWHLSW